MDLKRAKNVILNDKDYQFAADFARDSKLKKTSTGEQIVDKVLLPIAYHESKLKPTQLQKVSNFDYNKHGQGLYQFEKPSIRSALRRAFRLILKENEMPFTTNPIDLKKAKVPSYMINMYQNIEQGKEVDFTKLSAGQQSAVALFNFLGHGTANIDNVTSGDQTINSFWYNNHWAGSSKSNDETKVKRRISFSNDYSKYVEMSNEPKVEVGPLSINRVRNIKQPTEQGNLGGILDAR